MKKWILRGATGVIAIWLVAASWSLPQISRSLESYTRSLLSDPKHQGSFSDVKVTFSGQHAHLSGVVGSPEDRLSVGEITAKRVRAVNELGGKWNPVTAVDNQLRVDPAWNQSHPKPWLGVLLFEKEIKLSGLISSADLANKAAVALKAKMPGTEVSDFILIRDGARPALDWEATLSNAPDLQTQPNAAKAGAIAFTSCDGRWTSISDDADDAKVIELASAADVSSAAALELMNQWREKSAERAEKTRIASLPLPFAAVSVLPEAIHVYGHVFDIAEKKRLLALLTQSFPERTLGEHVIAAGKVRPGADWTVPLKSLPTSKEKAYSFSMSPQKHPSFWTTGGTLSEMTQSLSPRLPATFEDYPALYAHYDGWRRDVLTKEAKVLAEAQAKAAAAAAAEAALLMAKPKAPPVIQLPGYVGWTLDSTRLDLFGVVPDASLKTQIIDTAKSTFLGMTVNGDSLLLDPTRAASAADSIPFEKPADTTLPAVGLCEIGGRSKSYPAPVFDSEIARDFPALELKEGDLTQSLQGFRTRLVERKVLSLDAPYLSVISDGQTLTAVGELADAETKREALKAITRANSDLQIRDQITITPLVSASTHPKTTLDSTPSFKKGESGVAVVTPGQKWRTAVVHSIRFQTGSHRSKDQERALYQIRRVLKINPGAKFEITGHTDHVGSETANVKLSEQRAKNVTDGLSQSGIDPSILTTRGVGPKEPITDESTPEGQAQNRRVDVLLK